MDTPVQPQIEIPNSDNVPNAPNASGTYPTVKVGTFEFIPSAGPDGDWFLEGSPEFYRELERRMQSTDDLLSPEEFSRLLREDLAKDQTG